MSVDPECYAAEPYKAESNAITENKPQNIMSSPQKSAHFYVKNQVSSVDESSSVELLEQCKPENETLSLISQRTPPKQEQSLGSNSQCKLKNGNSSEQQSLISKARYPFCKFFKGKPFFKAKLSSIFNKPCHPKGKNSSKHHIISEENSMASSNSETSSLEQKQCVPIKENSLMHDTVISKRKGSPCSETGSTFIVKNQCKPGSQKSPKLQSMERGIKTKASSSYSNAECYSDTLNLCEPEDKNSSVKQYVLCEIKNTNFFKDKSSSFGPRQSKSENKKPSNQRFMHSVTKNLLSSKAIANLTAHELFETENMLLLKQHPFHSKSNYLMSEKTVLNSVNDMQCSPEFQNSQERETIKTEANIFLPGSYSVENQECELGSKNSFMTSSKNLLELSEKYHLPFSIDESRAVALKQHKPENVRSAKQYTVSSEVKNPPYANTDSSLAVNEKCARIYNILLNDTMVSNVKIHPTSITDSISDANMQCEPESRKSSEVLSVLPQSKHPTSFKVEPSSINCKQCEPNSEILTKQQYTLSVSNNILPFNAEISSVDVKKRERVNEKLLKLETVIKSKSQLPSSPESSSSDNKQCKIECQKPLKLQPMLSETHNSPSFNAEFSSISLKFCESKNGTASTKQLLSLTNNTPFSKAESSPVDHKEYKVEKIDETITVIRTGQQCETGHESSPEQNIFDKIMPLPSNVVLSSLNNKQCESESEVSSKQQSSLLELKNSSTPNNEMNLVAHKHDTGHEISLKRHSVIIVENSLQSSNAKISVDRNESDLTYCGSSKPGISKENILLSSNSGSSSVDNKKRESVNRHSSKEIVICGAKSATSFKTEPNSVIYKLCELKNDIPSKQQYVLHGGKHCAYVKAESNLVAQKHCKSNTKNSPKQPIEFLKIDKISFSNAEPEPVAPKQCESENFKLTKEGNVISEADEPPHSNADTNLVDGKRCKLINENSSEYNTVVLESKRTLPPSTETSSVDKRKCEIESRNSLRFQYVLTETNNVPSSAAKTVSVDGKQSENSSKQDIFKENIPPSSNSGSNSVDNKQRESGDNDSSKHHTLIPKVQKPTSFKTGASFVEYKLFDSNSEISSKHFALFDSEHFSPSGAKLSYVIPEQCVSKKIVSLKNQPMFYKTQNTPLFNYGSGPSDSKQCKAESDNSSKLQYALCEKNNQPSSNAETNPFDNKQYKYINESLAEHDTVIPKVKSFLPSNYMSSSVDNQNGKLESNNSPKLKSMFPNIKNSPFIHAESYPIVTHKQCESETWDLSKNQDVLSKTKYPYSETKLIPSVHKQSEPENGNSFKQEVIQSTTKMSSSSYAEINLKYKTESQISSKQQPSLSRENNTSVNAETSSVVHKQFELKNDILSEQEFSLSEEDNLSSSDVEIISFVHDQFKPESGVSSKVRLSEAKNSPSSNVEISSTMHKQFEPEIEILSKQPPRFSKTNNPASYNAETSSAVHKQFELENNVSSNEVKENKLSYKAKYTDLNMNFNKKDIKECTDYLFTKYGVSPTMIKFEISRTPNVNQPDTTSQNNQPLERIGAPLLPSKMNLQSPNQDSCLLFSQNKKRKSEELRDNLKIISKRFREDDSQSFISNKISIKSIQNTLNTSSNSSTSPQNEISPLKCLISDNIAEKHQQRKEMPRDNQRLKNLISNLTASMPPDSKALSNQLISAISAIQNSKPSTSILNNSPEHCTNFRVRPISTKRRIRRRTKIQEYGEEEPECVQDQEKSFQIIEENSGCSRGQNKITEDASRELINFSDLNNQFYSANNEPVNELQEYSRESEYVHGDDISFIVIRWNTDWLRFQINNNIHPPIWGENEICKVQNTYASDAEYFKTYYGLLLLGIWLNIHTAWMNNPYIYHCQLTLCTDNISCFINTCQAIIPFDQPLLKSIILVTCVWPDQRSQCVFGYVFDVKTEHYFYGQVRLESVKNVTFSFYSAEMIYTYPNCMFTIQLLGKLDVARRLSNALLLSELTAHKSVVLNPKSNSEKIKIVPLPLDFLEALQTNIDKIVFNKTSKEYLFTLVQRPRGMDTSLAILKIVHHCLINHFTILVCLRDTEKFLCIANHLKNVESAVLAVGENEVSMSRDLKRNMLRTQASNLPEMTFETAELEVLRNSQIILTLRSGIFLSSGETPVLGTNLVCVIDDAHLRTEAETALPLGYNPEKVVMFGNFTEYTSLHPFLRRLEYQRSLFHRLFICAE